MGESRKGDLVALETIRTMHYVNTHRSTSSREFRIVRVASATNNGVVTAIKDPCNGLVQKLKNMPGKPRVHTIEDHQEAARRLIASRTSDDPPWSSTEDLKKAILEMIK